MLSFIFLHHISNSIPLLILKNQNNNNNNNINVKINIKSITRIFCLQILIPVKVKY